MIRKIAKDLENTAKMHDVKVLEKYINLLDPTRIVTREDVIRIVRREMGKI